MLTYTGQACEDVPGAPPSRIMAGLVTPALAGRRTCNIGSGAAASIAGLARRDRSGLIRISEPAGFA
jgi:hypothetical protein